MSVVPDLALSSLGATWAVVLVEGPSDQAALEALAERRGRDLAAEQVAVVAMGGATSIAPFLDRFGPHGLDLQIVGLCDEAESHLLARALARAGVGAVERDELPSVGFQVCVTDLEDELIRALGVPRFEAVVREQGEWSALETFRQQPAQRDRTPEQQLHRFCGTKGGRKVRYGRALVDALDLDAVPAPLDAVLAAV